MTLDHLIASVPDIRATHARLLAMGFDEAWPVGPFWPSAQTSGIALGGVNLELVQPDAGASEARIDTLVLAPSNLDEGYAAFDGHDLRLVNKVEPDARLLALRGFPPEMTAGAQPICDNLYPREEGIAFPFFLCVYAPFLKSRLATGNFAQPRGPVVSLVLVAPDPEAVRHLFAGRLGPIGLDVERGERSEVAAIHFADESVLTAADL